MRPEPLGWSLGVAIGVAVAVFLGGFIPAWGLALAPAAATAVFSVGAYRVPEDEALAWVLRVTIALTIGFVAATAPITLYRVAQSTTAGREAEDLLLVRGPEEVRQKLMLMWTVMASMVPVGAISLAVRARRLAQATIEELPNDSK